RLTGYNFLDGQNAATGAQQLTATPTTLTQSDQWTQVASVNIASATTNQYGLSFEATATGGGTAYVRYLLYGYQVDPNDSIATGSPFNADAVQSVGFLGVGQTQTLSLTRQTTFFGGTLVVQVLNDGGATPLIL